MTKAESREYLNQLIAEGKVTITKVEPKRRMADIRRQAFIRRVKKHQDRAQQTA